MTPRHHEKVRSPCVNWRAANSDIVYNASRFGSGRGNAAALFHATGLTDWKQLREELWRHAHDESALPEANGHLADDGRSTLEPSLTVSI